ncbi:DUF881 domain-containing protein [Nocardioides ultimimeridianus]
MPDSVPGHGPDHVPHHAAGTGPDPAAADQPTARQRVLAGLRSTSRRQLIVGVLLALLGFGAVTQVRANRTDDTYAGQRQQDLIDILDALSGARQRQDAEVSRLTTVHDDLSNDSTKRQAAVDQANGQVADLQILAGLVPVTGPGIRITITEETGKVKVSSLLDTIEELRTVGAEAMQINGKVRIVAQTAFEPDSAGFLVDGQQVQAPYVIDVIGDSDVLSGAMNFALGPKQQLNDDGAQVRVDQLSSLDIEAVTDRDHTKQASPDQ